MSKSAASALIETVQADPSLLAHYRSRGRRHRHRDKTPPKEGTIKRPADSMGPARCRLSRPFWKPVKSGVGSVLTSGPSISICTQAIITRKTPPPRRNRRHALEQLDRRGGAPFEQTPTSSIPPSTPGGQLEGPKPYTADAPVGQPTNRCPPTAARQRQRSFSPNPPSAHSPTASSKPSGGNPELKFNINPQAFPAQPAKAR